MEKNIQNIKVCLIEDDDAFLYLAQIIIKSIDRSVEVMTFKDGDIGFNFFEHNKTNTTMLPDIIFLDLNMPRMDGWQFLKAYENIKDQINKPIPIYILSSSISEKDISQAKNNALVADFINKPIEEFTLVQIFNQVRIK